MRSRVFDETRPEYIIAVGMLCDLRSARSVVHLMYGPLVKQHVLRVSC